MPSFNRLLVITSVLVTILFIPSSVHAKEQISSFDIKHEIDQSSDILVEERILYNFDGARKPTEIICYVFYV